MKNKISLVVKRLVVYTTLSCMVSQTAVAGLTDISNVPLATAGGSTVLPNLLFTLDDSFSMTWDFMPDYVNPNQQYVSLAQSNPCMTDNTGRTYCVRGDPPYEAGGSAGFNGVGYDPNFYYHAGVNSNGTAVVNPLISVSPATVARADAYNSASAAVNLNTSIADMSYCNSQNVCKRNGANTTGTVVSGTAFLDSSSSSTGTTMGAGEFPYRTNPANASTAVFGLPEMMSIASFTRSATTVTATTLTAHGLATTDKIYVTSSGNSGLNVTCVAINTTPTATTFTYTATSSGTITATSGNYRRCTDGSFTRASSTVTVTKASHGLVNGDVITTFVTSGNAMNTANVVISGVTSNSFQYTTGTSGSLSATGGFWVRTGLYNVGSSVNGPPVSYSIIPVEYCTDRNLTNCSAVKAIPNPTGTFTQSGTTVTVTSSSHGLATGDKVTASSTTRSANATAAAVTVIDANTFSYTSPTSATVGAATPISISSAPANGFTFPAYVRFCQTQEQALSPGVISDSGGTPRCRRVYNEDASFTQYLYPRYGFFRRDTITSTVATYANRPGRTDCAAVPTCTYTEEIANYARWYTYYRTRMQMMKSALGESLLAFIGSPAGSPPKPNALRLGLITINAYYTNPSPPTTGPTGSGSSSPGNPSARYQRIADFDTTQASNFYSKLYSIYPPLAGTPLQSALARAGWIYAGKMNTGLTSGIPATDDPVQSACQRNYTLLTTDGYWNYLSSTPPYQLDGTTVIGNLDNTAQTFSGSTLVDRTSTNTLDGLNGITDTVTTNSSSSEQVICQANFAVNPSIDPAPGSGRNCGCLVKEHALYQENVSSITTVHQVNGVTQTTTPGTSINFTNVSGCVAANWQDVAQPKLQYEVRQCDRATSSTVSFTLGGSASCNSCASTTSAGSKRYVLVRQKRLSTQTSTFVDSNPTPTQVQPGSPTITYEYCNAGAGCSASGSAGWTSTPPSNSSACTSTSIASNPPIGVQTAVNNGSSSVSGSATGTPLTIALSPNPQTTIGGPVTTTFTGAGTSSTLADTALYFYKTNLRAGGTSSGPKFSPATTPANTVDLSGNQMILKSGGKDFMPYQHMVTFGIGLADGFMNYQSDYEIATSGDYFNIKSGANNACFWSSPGICNWAQPKDGAPAPGPSGANLDDLWHAAVNGRGNFYQATNPEALRTGIGSALSALNSQIAAAAASATSSPNVTQTDNQIFSTTYETNTWSGRVYAQLIDPTNATVLPTHLWDGDTLLVQKVSAGSDSRNILTFDSGASTKLKQFSYATLTGSEQVYFSNRCAPPVPATALSQCSLMTPAQVTLANDGTRFVGYLRGWQQDETVLFRDRQLIDPITGNVTNTVLGDTISARPMYVRNPTLSYTDPVTPSYSSYASTNSNRASRVFVAANDGFLHAFDGNTGNESWAYLPRFLMPALYYLADNTYGLQHRFYLDGSPEAFDVYDATAGAWKTVLIGGAGGGASGFYALDITDPVNPKGLWEFCNDSTLCNINDANVGLSYGNPIVGKRSSDGRWVAVLSSGLNNTSGSATGHGVFYVLDVITGAILNRVDTGVGTLTTPSGLMKMSAFYDSAATDATFRYLYGGDQLGNIWRLDMGDVKGACDAPASGSATAPCLTHFATLKDASGIAQPITTRPAITHIGTNRVLYIGTGRYIGAQDLTDTHLTTGSAYQQTLYGIKDKNVDYGTNVRTGAQLVTQTLTLISSTDRGITNNPVDWSAKDGWMVDFNPVADPTPGERVNIDPRLVLGTLRVITNIPAGGGACSVGGTSKIYDFDFRTGSTVAGTGSVVGTSSDTLIVGQAIVQTQTGDIYGLNKREDTGDDTSKVKQKPGGSGIQRFSYRER